MPIFSRSVLRKMKIPTSKLTSMLFFPFLTVAVASIAGAGSAPKGCDQQLYTAPDGRLRPDVLAASQSPRNRQ